MLCYVKDISIQKNYPVWIKFNLVKWQETLIICYENHKLIIMRYSIIPYFEILYDDRWEIEIWL